MKARKKEQAKGLSRGAAGVDCGSVAHFLDTVHHNKLAWNAISDGTKKDEYNTLELVTLRVGVDEEVDLMANILHSFEA